MMSHDNRNSQNLLNDAIREASGMHDQTHRAASTRQAAASPGPGLPNVLNELTGTVGGAMPTRANAEHSESPNSLREALQGQWQGKTPSGSKAAPRPHLPVRTGINELIREVSGVQSGGPAGAFVTDKTGDENAVRFGQAVHDVYGTPQPTATDTGSVPGMSLRNIAFVVVAISLLTAGAAIWWWANHHDSGPSGTLHELAKAAEHYRAGHNGQLPKELATLEAFPRDAVDWPLRYWKARDAAGRTEIIWVPLHSGHYRIVLRQGSQTWTVSDSQNTPILIKKDQPQHD